MATQNIHRETIPQDGFLRLKQVLKLVPVSSVTLWRWEKVGKFPQRIRISDNVSVWPVEAIRAWIKANGGG